MRVLLEFQPPPEWDEDRGTDSGFHTITPDASRPLSFHYVRPWLWTRGLHRPSCLFAKEVKKLGYRCLSSAAGCVVCGNCHYFLTHRERKKWQTGSDYESHFSFRDVKILKTVS